MAAKFIDLDSHEKLEALFQASHHQPVVIFKHSSTCGISAGVYREVESVEADVNIVVVQRNRDISNAISQRTGIRHESPQAIVLVNQVREALDTVARAAPDPPQELLDAARETFLRSRRTARP